MEIIKLLIASSLAVGVNNAFACSKITHNFGESQVLTAHVFDFCMDTPVDIAISPRGMKESGNIIDGRSVHWISKYGSITVREHFGESTIASPLGMNEKGLAVHLLYLSSAEFPEYNHKKRGVNLFNFTKYILDNYASVDEVVDNFAKIQIANYPINIHGMKVKFPAHFAFDDASGDSAVIEYIDGKLKIYHGKQYGVMTNEPHYDLQLKNLAKYQAESTQYNANNLPGGAYSSNRFIRAYYYDTHLPNTPDKNRTSVSYMFSLIQGVSSPYFANYPQKCGFDSNGLASEDTWPSKWSAVLDHQHRIMYFHDNADINTVKISLNSYNLNKGEAVIILKPEQESN